MSATPPSLPPSRRASDSTVRRLSLYLRFLEDFQAEGRQTVSSRHLASRGSTTAAQVRKDLSLFGSFGKRGLGYDVPQLAERLRDILGLARPWRVALVGAGRIGSALFHYPGFQERGFQLTAILDVATHRVGESWGAIRVQHVADLETVVRDGQVDIVVVAVPGPAAQEVVDRAVAGGVKAFLNFAPVSLKVPSGVAVNNVNLAAELEVLSFHLLGRDARE
ncbi:MAG: redox-sensing transcriptional repressor Rex [Gemmatimonadota bacterium]